MAPIKSLVTATSSKTSEVSDAESSLTTDLIPTEKKITIGELDSKVAFTRALLSTDTVTEVNLLLLVLFKPDMSLPGNVTDCWEYLVELEAELSLTADE